MTDRELMQQALDALEGYARNCRCEGGGAPCDTAEALRARLANEFDPDWDAMAVMVEEQQRMAKRIEELEAALAQPEQEPVAWMVVNGEGKIEQTSHYKPECERWLRYDSTRRLVPLYTALSQRGWQGLTDEEIVEIRAIEAKLKEKSHD